MEILFQNKLKNPLVSIILLDWSCRESFHSLRYLNQQTVARDSYEILWIEYYTRKPSQIASEIKECEEKRKPPVIDQWIILGMPDNVCYHKHLMYNVGIVRSRGDIIVICDSDAIFKPSFIKTIIKSFKDNPDIVMHLDEVRNGDKKFHPFSYPSIQELTKNGCTNWKDGKTTGLWDKSDPIHTRNYGACMAAKRSDLIAIGGADEHMDYLGHVCGPYEMTFRMVNAGKKEIWHESEFLYHAWHPGQSGDKNYVGPHDGRLISTTTLDVLKSGRIMPLVENEAIKMLRTGNDVNKQKLQEKLVDNSYRERLNFDRIENEEKIRIWYNHERIMSYKECNIIKYRDKFYGVPTCLHINDLGKEDDMSTIVTADTQQAVMKKIDQLDSSWFSPQVIEVYKDYNITRYGGRVYGIPQTLIGLDLPNPEERRDIVHLSAGTIEGIKELIDKTDRSMYFPVLVEVYKDYNITKYGKCIYGIPQTLIDLDLLNPEERRTIEHLSAGTIEGVKELIDKTDRSIYFPVLINAIQDYNIIKYHEKIYGVPQRLGKVDFTQDIGQLPSEVLLADTRDEMELLIRQRLSGGNNIDNESTITHQESDAFTPEKTSAVSNRGVSIDNSNPMADLPSFSYEYKNYNIVRYNDYYYAVPQSIGAIDFRDDAQRRHPEIISDSEHTKLQTRIDQLENSVPIEYAGWLPSFKRFGNCGCHPQFAHIDTPPPGYRFTYSKPRQNNDPSTKERVWQRVVFLVRGIFILIATLKCSILMWLKGARLRDIFHYLKTRDFKSQFLLSRKHKMVFLPSVPYTIGQHPWIIEIEDSISFLFPLFHNGQTAIVNLHESPYFPIFKTLIESKQCKGIITHIKSTAESLPKLFKNDKLSSKITHVPLGVNLPGIFRDINKKDKKVQFLFNNSWHQDPRNFFLRGGLDVLSAFDKLQKKYPNIFLTLRTPLPLMDPHYMEIMKHDRVKVIDKFLPDHEWELLIRNSDIYLLPSARIHVVSTLEAMSYGLVVVVGDGWGVEEYIQHGINGMIIKGRYGKTSWMDDKTGMLRENYKLMQEEDPVVVKGLVEVLSSLVEGRDLLNRISKQARMDIKTKYNLENWNNGLKIAFDKAFLKNGRGKT